MKKISSLLALLAAIILGIVAIRPTGDVSAQGKTKPVDGKSVYHNQCAKCHGEDGKGITSLPDIPNFADAKWQTARTDKRITEVINVGAGIMPGFKEVLSATDVRALVKHVRSFGAAKAKTK
ncbi:MAG: c-type cytochrome [Acidobacteriota bacterium]